MSKAKFFKIDNMDPTIGSIITGGLGAIGNVWNGINSSKNTKRMIAAQKEMNEKNIASQERINQQNIDFQKGINDIMRHDANHAISIKKADLQRAGYSTADPNQQGFTAANLGGVNLQAPQVQSEFTPEMANLQQQGINSFASGMLNTASTLSSIALQKAQTREHDRNVDLKDKELAWFDVEHKAMYERTLQEISNMATEQNWKKADIKRVMASVEQINKSVDLLGQQIIQLQLANKFKPIEFQKAMDHLDAVIDDLKSAKGLKDAQKMLTLKEKDIADIKYQFARIGVNFDSSSITDSIARLLLSGHATEVLDRIKALFHGIINYDSFGGFKEYGKSFFENSKKNLMFGPLYGTFATMFDAVKKHWRNRK
ncbi:DNA pilot protein [Sigmofec virus UA08Rod_3874]|uniref:DNA pilot protein n=1 Tax=Sigmofec virus UA08Rod_3874 TaxID=2929391 RepID=A0A976N1P7_9VIRU|nr:DNA pilot protein [Sigmofec virus UA08Rod_3874]